MEAHPVQPSGLAIDQVLQQAVAFHKNGEIAEAEHLYRAILAADPRHADANHNLGVLALQLHHPEQALPYLRTALEANPKQGQFWLSYVDALLQTQRVEEAGNVLQQGVRCGLAGESVDVLAARIASAGALSPVIEQVGDRISQDKSATPPEVTQNKTHGQIKRARQKGSKKAHLQKKSLAWVSIVASFDAGRYTEVVRLASAFTLRHSGNGMAWRVQGLALAHLGLHDKALAALTHASVLLVGDAETHRQLGIQQQRCGLLREAEASFLHAIELAPRDAASYNNLGTLFHQQGKLAEAENYYRRALELNPHTADAYSNLGVLLRAQQRYIEAEARYREALTLNPTYVDALSNLGNLLRDLNRNEESRDCYLQALAFDPQFAKGYANLGDVYASMGEYSKAVSAYEHALRLDSTLAETYNNLGVIAKHEGRLRDAETCYRAAVRLKPNYAEALCNLGNILKLEGDHAAAEASYRDAIQSRPELAEAHSNLSVLLHERGQVQEAEICCRHAIALNPRSADAYNNLGNILHEGGRLEEAELNYRNALALDGRHPEARLNLAYTLYALDQTGKAIDAYEMVAASSLGIKGLEAQLNLAVLRYLNGETKEASRLQILASPLLERVDADRNLRTYCAYLGKLLRWHDGHQMTALAEGMLHVIGESHALSASGLVVSYGGKHLQCTADWIMGCKQWHLGNNQPNKYKCKFEKIVARLPRRSTIMICIGEIDCRMDEGILKAWRRGKGESLEEIAKSTVSAYISYLQRMTIEYGHSLIICGIPAPYPRREGMAGDDVVQLVAVIKAVNAFLRQQSALAGMDFLDVHAITDRGDGISGEEWHIDQHHLLPLTVLLAFARHGA